MSKYPKGKFERHPLSVPGPFYVEDGQCINCLAPADKAPDLFGYFAEPPGMRGCSHCYVKQQPRTPAELERMLQAIQASCCSGLRYCGNDPAILKRLRQDGFAGRCDELWDADTGAAANSNPPARPAGA
jgi:hypothetical protein